MKVVGIQAKDGRIEVAIDKEEAKRATEVNSRRQNGYGGLTKTRTKKKHQEEIHSHGNRTSNIFLNYFDTY